MTTPLPTDDELTKLEELARNIIGLNEGENDACDVAWEEIEKTAKSIAQHGCGRDWNEFTEVKIDEMCQSELKEYAEAALRSEHVQHLSKSIVALIARVRVLEIELFERQQSFDLRWKADKRAIKRWQAENPKERNLTWPDHADMVVWLLCEDRRHRSALKESAKTFRHYAMLHTNKTPPDNTKAAANQQMALICELALQPDKATQQPQKP